MAFDVNLNGYAVKTQQRNWNINSDLIAKPDPTFIIKTRIEGIKKQNLDLMIMMES
jgi:hypothetical protein